MIDKILKQDGSYEEFVSFKIEDAIKKAFESEHTDYDNLIF